MSEFARATAIAPLGGGRYSATIDETWSAVGPNGGYVAAIVLRALAESVADPERHPRSLTLHYLRAPAPGRVDVVVTVERVGGSLTSLSARLEQDGRVCAIALAAFAISFEPALEYDEPPPSVRPWRGIEPWPLLDRMPPISGKIEMRSALGPAPFTAGAEGLTGGWLRLRDPEPADAFVLALYTDAWIPVPFMRLERPVPAPTIDLNIHFRAPEVVVDGDEPVLVRYRSSTSHDGFFEEDGEIWGQVGEHFVLLAQSRQLALLRAPRA